MRELGRLFRTYCHDSHAEWPRYVHYIEWVLNHTIHEATGFTPQELFMIEACYNPIYETVECPPGALENPNQKLIMAREIQRTKAEERRRRHDRKGRFTKFQVGDEVLVRTHNLSSAVDKQIQNFFLLYEGPCTVVAIKKSNAYVVKDTNTLRVRGTYNIIHLRPYIKPVTT